MKYLVRFVTHWRVEVVLAAMVLTLGTTMRAQTYSAVWCSEEAVLSYDSEINLCLGAATDCYMCIVWARLAE